MGRGLSDLQKTILRLAYENHISEARELPRFRVVVYEPMPPPSGPLVEFGANATGEEMHAAVAANRILMDEAVDSANTQLQAKVQGLCDRLTWIGESTLAKAAGGYVRAIVGEFESETEAKKRCQDFTVRGIDARVHPEFSAWADLYSHEVLIAAFGFGEYRRIGITGKPALLRGYAENRRLPSGKFFDRSKIGEERYNTAVVSVSRAFARLEERGLIHRIYAGSQWMGIDLTPEGLDLAATLLANTHDNVTTLSQ